MHAVQASLVSLVGLNPITLFSANELLTEWEHPLGACKRPFGSQAWALELNGSPIAVAISASTVSKTVAGYSRGEVVELARIGRHPDHPGAIRPVLRLWRDYLAQSWPYWPVKAAISYAMPGTPGNIYRFDGWERIGKCRVSPGGGTWTIKDPKVSRIADGIKTLWVYRYEAVGAV